MPDAAQAQVVSGSPQRRSAKRERSDREFTETAKRFIRALGARLEKDDPRSYGLFREIRAELDLAEVRAVTGWRASGWTDRDIGIELPKPGTYEKGITQQAVQQRWPRQGKSYRWEFLLARGPGPHPCHFCHEPVAYEDVGEPYHSESLIVHHVDHDRSNNGLGNLVPAHRICHTRYHARYSKIARRQAPKFRSFHIGWSIDTLAVQSPRKLFVKGRPCEVGDVLRLTGKGGIQGWVDVIAVADRETVISWRSDQTPIHVPEKGDPMYDDVYAEAMHDREDQIDELRADAWPHPSEYEDDPQVTCRCGLTMRDCEHCDSDRWLR